MTNIEAIDTLDEIQIHSEKILEILNTLCEEFGVDEENAPTAEFFASKVFAKNAPQSYRNSYDFVVGYKQIMTFIDIALDYTHLIFKTTSIKQK